MEQTVWKFSVFYITAIFLLCIDAKTEIENDMPNAQRPVVALLALDNDVKLGILPRSHSSTTSSNAVQERTHSKTSSQAGTSVGSSSHSANSLSLNWRDSRPPRDDNHNGSGNDYTRLMMSDRRQKIVVCV